MFIIRFSSKKSFKPIKTYEHFDRFKCFLRSGGLFYTKQVQTFSISRNAFLKKLPMTRSPEVIGIAKQ